MREVRIVVDVERSVSGRIAGSVSTDECEPTTFEGWLDLVRLLENRIEPPTPGEEP